MKPDEKVVAEAIRIEYNPESDRLFVVFEVSDPNYKKFIKTNWTKDIEFKINNKSLTIEEE